MTSPKQRPLLASQIYPYPYRLILTTIEPILTTLGILTVLYDPSLYFSNLTRLPRLQLAAATAAATDPFTPLPAYTPDTAFLYTQLIAGWLVFTFNEAVILRLVDDARIWRLLVFGMLLSDLAYCHGCAQAVGGWREWWVGVDAGDGSGAGWGWDEWALLATTAPVVLARVGLVLGVGVKKGREAEELAGEERKRV